MAITITSRPDRALANTINYEAVVDTPTVTSIDWAFGDSSTQAGAAVTDGVSRVSHTYTTPGPYTVTATPKPSGTAATKPGVAVSPRYSPRSKYDPFAPFVAAPDLAAAPAPAPPPAPPTNKKASAR
jgi:PKD repeat protein